MSVIGIILLVAFIIICVLLIAIVLLQNEEGEGLGGIFGGSGSAAFGSRSGNVLTKTTYVLVTLFFLTSFGLAYVNKTPTEINIDTAVQETQTATGSEEYWNEDTNVSEEAPAEIKALDTETVDTESVTAE